MSWLKRIHANDRRRLGLIVPAEALAALCLMAGAVLPASVAEAAASSATSSGRADRGGRLSSDGTHATAHRPSAMAPRQGRKKRHARSARAATKAPAASGAPDGADGLPFAISRSSHVTRNQEGRIVVFPFRNDEGGTLSAQVGQLLAARGLDVMTDVKPVDSAEQFRDLATALHLAAYVEGDVSASNGKPKAVVRLRSGFSGRKMTEVAFKETWEDMPRAISDRLWAKLGPSVAHACADAGRPRKKSRSTMEINAGTPIDTVPNAPRAPAGTADQGTGKAKAGGSRAPDRKAPAAASASVESA